MIAAPAPTELEQLATLGERLAQLASLASEVTLDVSRSACPQPARDLAAWELSIVAYTVRRAITRLERFLAESEGVRQ